MKLDFSGETIEINCQSCGKKIAEKLGRLQRDPQLTCPHCKGVTTVDAAKLRAVIQTLQKSLDDLGRNLRRTFK